MPDPAVCVRPPAYAYVAAHGDLLTQLGATKVEATDSMTVKATFADSAHAVTADALLKDTVWGAKLVVDSQTRSTEAVSVTADGIADVLRGVQGANVQVSYAKGGPNNAPVANAMVGVSSSDPTLVQDLTELVEPHPAAHVGVWIAFTGRAQDGS
jgi:hypothetical protein